MSRLKRLKEFDESMKRHFKRGTRLRIMRVKTDPLMAELMAVEFIMACVIAVSLYIYFDKNVNIFPPEVKIPFPFNTLGIVALVILAVLIYYNYMYIRLKSMLKKSERLLAAKKLEKAQSKKSKRR